ncbi:MAG: hypothetical protein ABIK45_11955 [Pseudomonadota bacterium]
MSGFIYEETYQDEICPFCGSFVPKGMSVCASCEAVHGSTLSGFGKLSAFLFILFSGVMSLTAGMETESFLVGILLFLLLIGLSGMLAAKLFTRKGWFRS